MDGPPPELKQMSGLDTKQIFLMLVEALAQGHRTSLKRQGPHVRARWKGRRKQPPEAPFSAAFSVLS